MAIVALLPIIARAAPPSVKKRRAPLLWRVEMQNRRSYLFGTVHVPLDLDTALGEEGRAALGGSKRVFLEMDTTSDTALSFLLHAADRAELPPKESLRAMLRPPTWNRLTRATRNVLSTEQLDRLEPWFVALTVVQLAVPPGRPSPHLKPGTPPLDFQIGDRARAQGTPVEALEPILDHLQAMSRMPRSEGVAMVEEALKDPEANRDAIAGLIGAYAAEDDRPILKAFGKLVRRKPALAERIIFRRNEAWCERLQKWLPDGNMFVAAGGFHMLGDRGLVALLRQRGYRVERVRPASATPTVAAR